MEPLKSEKDYDNPISSNSYLQIGRIHGLKYLSSPRKFDRIFWGLAMISSIIFMVYFLFINQNQSVNVEVSEKLPLHTIPFPAVTICPETKAKKSLASFTDAYHDLIYNLTEQQYDDKTLSYIEALSQVCDSHLFAGFNITHDLPTSGDQFLKILNDIAVPKNQTIILCKYRNEIVDCSDIFVESLTDDGICYTFNMVNYENLYRQKYSESDSDWKLDTGYKSKDIEANPKPALSGSDFGLNIVLNVKSSDLDFMCKGPAQGYKVRIHSPDEHPKIMNGFFRVALNNDVIASIHPHFYSDEEGGGINCHTERTKKLEYFHGYSQKNCLDECLTKYVLETCECVKFSMVHRNGTRICNQQENDCVVLATNNFFTVKRFRADHLCDCKPSCKEFDYKIVTSVAEFDFKKVFMAFNEPLESEYPKAIMSRLQLFISDDYFIQKTYKRAGKERSILAEKISHIGGLMAFFIGASVLSILEIIYFLFKKLCTCC